MSLNEKAKEVGKQIDRGTDWIEGVLAIGCGIALPVFAWSKRPIELRDFSETAVAALQDQWVLKPAYFYGSFLVAVALIVYGIGKLRSVYR